MTQLRAHSIDHWLRSLNPNAVVMIEGGSLMAFDGDKELGRLEVGTCDEHAEPGKITQPEIGWKELEESVLAVTGSGNVLPGSMVYTKMNIDLTIAPIDVMVNLPAALPELPRGGFSPEYLRHARSLNRHYSHLAESITLSPLPVFGSESTLGVFTGPVIQEDGLPLMLAPGADPDEECDHCHGPLLANWPSGTMRFCSIKCKDNYEPPDGPGWEGGFACNH